MQGKAVNEEYQNHLNDVLEDIRNAGMWKRERPLVSAQAGVISVAVANGASKKDSVINLCANNYLGLANNPELVNAAKSAMDESGYGMASVRFICGTHELHETLERRLARFLEKDDAILFAACFDANGGLFEPLLGPKDAIISDALNHACLLYTSPSPRDRTRSRMPSSA